MLRNRLLFTQNAKSINLAGIAVNLKSKAKGNVNFCTKPKAKLAAILPALLVAFTASFASGNAFSATAAYNDRAQTIADTKVKDEERFTVIAHRGASGYLPEHTLEAATLAFSLRPDFIEQDVVITKDDIPVVLHDIHLETVTNVEDVFPARHRGTAVITRVILPLKNCDNCGYTSALIVTGAKCLPIDIAVTTLTSKWLH